MFDVIIPTYQTPSQYLKEAIDSVLSQTYQEFQIYICDGNKEDAPLAARQILSDYEDERIHILPQEGFGVSQARNQAVTAGNNPYIALLDADDLWEPEKLECYKNILETTPNLKMVWGASKQIFEGQEEIEYRAGFFEGWEHTLPHHRWFRVYWHPIMTSTIVYERNTLEKLGLWNEVAFMGEDTELNLRFLLRYPFDCRQLNAYVGTYRWHPRSVRSNQPFYQENMNAGIFALGRPFSFSAMLKVLKNQDGENEYHSQEYWNTLESAIKDYRHGNNIEVASAEGYDYVLKRVDGVDIGSLQKEDTPSLGEFMGVKA
jgi:glycosyltransferase involved in cell wall biosynthesis